MIAKITTRRVDEAGSFKVSGKDIDIVSALDMVDEMEDCTAAPLREILRWFCDREFPVPAKLAASFESGDYRITVKHVVDGDVSVAVFVEKVKDRPEEVEVSFPSEAVKEL